jgi:2-polyprenyl-3-methyl-5-hydroxy-6-metoxy-1,4-benzoquinol methylase
MDRIQNISPLNKAIVITLSVIMIVYLISISQMVNSNTIQKYINDEIHFQNGLEDNCGLRMYTKQSIYELSKAAQRNWQTLGLSVPWWSVFAGEPKSSEIDENRKLVFYNSGREEINFILEWSSKFGLNYIDGRMVALDFGCGLGRISWNLADNFKTVLCVDQSKPHLEIAKKETGAKTNIKYFEVDVETLDQVPEFDRFYSVISLQHAVPVVQYLNLKKLFMRLRNGGQMIFQFAAHLPGYKFRDDCTDEMLKYEMSRLKSDEFHVHPLSLNSVLQLAHESGLLVVDVKEWDRLGGGSSKAIYLIKT